MPSATIRVPDSLRTGGYLDTSLPLAKAVKNRMEGIFTRICEKENIAIEDIEIDHFPAEPTVHANIWLSSDHYTLLKAISGRFKLTDAEAGCFLMQSDAAKQIVQVEEKAIKGPQSTLDKIVKDLKWTSRPEQSHYYRQLSKFLVDPESDGKVLFAEAGTGVGKTLSYLSLTVELMQSALDAGDPKPTIFIALPTYALISSVFNDFSKIQQKLGINTAVTLAGQSDFVSEQALRSLIEKLLDSSQPSDKELAEQLVKWLAAGAPALPNFRNTSRWTMESLKDFVPCFKHEAAVGLSARHDNYDQGYLAYLSQWDSAKDKKVWIMTHAMLASLACIRYSQHWVKCKNDPDLKAEMDKAISEWKSIPEGETRERLFRVINGVFQEDTQEEGEEFSKLPNCDLLIVDEAHQIDDAFDSVMSQRLSFFGFQRDLEAIRSVLPNNKIVKASHMKAFYNVKDTLFKCRDEKISLGEGQGFAILHQMQEVFSGVAKIGAKSDTTGIKQEVRRLKQAARSIDAAIKSANLPGMSKSALSGYIDWSPDKSWPRMIIGPLSVYKQMDYLWRAVSKKTVLASGTLYTKMPNLSMESTRANLNIDRNIAVAIEPIHAEWQFTPVTICIAKESSFPDGSKKLVRPSRSAEKYNELHDLWIESIALYIIQAHRSSAGGMLVLSTAFDDTNALGKKLAHLAPLLNVKDLILVHNKDTGLATLKELFFESISAGKRPILIGAGGAWTGFDLYRSEFPDALTDLVILNAPYGVVRKTLAETMRSFTSKVSFYDHSSKMLQILRQGIGRLVRSPDTKPNRKIHWLDARIHAKEHAATFGLARRVWDRYKNRMEV